MDVSSANCHNAASLFICLFSCQFKDSLVPVSSGKGIVDKSMCLCALKSIRKRKDGFINLGLSRASQLLHMKLQRLIAFDLLIPQTYILRWSKPSIPQCHNFRLQRASTGFISNINEAFA